MSMVSLLGVILVGTRRRDPGVAKEVLNRVPRGWVDYKKPRDEILGRR